MTRQHQLLTTIILSFFIKNGAAQINITLADPQPNLIEVYGGSFASGDIDNDGDQDLLMTGITPTTALYLNDGSGGFTNIIMDTDLPNRAHDCVTEFLDLDNDGDLDLYFSGNNDGGGIGEFTRIYTNDGSGNFTLISNPDLPQFRGTGAAFSDIDNDGDLDLFISALDENNQFISGTYLNDGNAIFTPAQSGVFSFVKYSAIAFIDIENDNDMDVIVAGKQPNNSPLTKLYINDGSGQYSVDNINTFENLSSGGVDVADIDSDGDQDILISGDNANFENATYLYLNDGAGNFEALQNSTLQPTLFGNQAISDLDLDGDLDIVIVNPNGSIVYENVGSNNFNVAANFTGDYIGDCLVTDFNNDGYPDIVIQGSLHETNFYWNNSGSLGASDFGAESIDCWLSPNPAIDHLQIRLETTQADKNYVIYDLSGKIIQRGTLISDHSSVEVSGFSNGLYFIKIGSLAPVSFLKS